MDVTAVLRGFIRDRRRQHEPRRPGDRIPPISAIEVQTHRRLNPAGEWVLLAASRPRVPTSIIHPRTHRHRGGARRGVGHRHRGGDGAVMHLGHGLAGSLGDRPRGTGVGVCAPAVRSPRVGIGASRTDSRSGPRPRSRCRAAGWSCAHTCRTRAARRLRTVRSVICGPRPCCIRSATTRAVRSPSRTPAGSRRWRAAGGTASAPWQ
jgi:hypothetical protein